MIRRAVPSGASKPVMLNEACEEGELLLWLLVALGTISYLFLSPVYSYSTTWTVKLVVNDKEGRIVCTEIVLSYRW